MRLALVILAVLLAACSPMHYARGVPNLAQVDANVWRSGQISTLEGWQTIAQIADGRRVHVIKLNFEDEGTDEGASAFGFDVAYLPIQPAGDRGTVDDVLDVFATPDYGVVRAAESILARAAQTIATDIYLVHCTHGQDRTGFIVGLHRELHDGWDGRRAFKEMLDHHFHVELVGLMRAWLSFPRTP